MAITTINHTLIQADAEQAKGVFTATKAWKLEIEPPENELDAHADRVAFAFGVLLPLEGATYPSKPLVTSRSVGCKRSDVNGVYVYTAKYSDENADVTNNKPATGQNPLDDLPVIRPTAGMKSIAIDRDRDNHAILNSALDPVAQSRDDNTIGFSVESNQALVPWWILAYRNSTNVAPIVIDGLTIPENAARMVLPSDWKSTIKSRNGVQYVVFKFELLIDEQDQHHGRPLDAGFRELQPIYELDANGNPADPPVQKRRPVYEVDGNGDVITDVNGDPVQATDENGDPVWGDLLWHQVAITEEDGSEPSNPVPLDAGLRLESPTPSTVTFLEVKKYYPKDYTVLPGIEAAP